MLLKQFPDIHWLRGQAKTNFNNQRAVNNKRLSEQGWPSVVLNTKSLCTERTDIIAPFSLFLNLSGKSLVRSDRKEIRLTADNFCLVNKAYAYDLIIPQSATTFNIHFGDKLFTEMAAIFQNKPNQFLDSPIDFKADYSDFKVKSIWKDNGLRKSLTALQLFYKHNNSDEFGDHREYDLLSAILSLILTQQNEVLAYPPSISSTKASTRIELISRLTLSVDYIHAHYYEYISLDQLSAVACLSKFHYLRTFKEAFHCTPQQMIAKCRLEKAKSLMLNTNIPLSEIAISVGFSELAAFSRFFNRAMGISAQVYRKQN